jgi:hypothetical protein
MLKREMTIVKFRTRVGNSMKLQSQRTIKLLFSAALCMSLLVYLPLEINATNVEGSDIIFPSDTLALQEIEISVWANGTLGSVEGALVNISAPQGIFQLTAGLWALDTTDDSGYARFQWQAPDTPTEMAPINVTLTANISSGIDQVILQENITIHPIDFSKSSMLINPKTVYEYHNSSIAVYANSSIFPYGVEDATVDLFCDEGVFIDTGTATTSLLTNTWGWVLVYWQANLSITITNPLDVNITANISYTGKIVNASLTDTITVNPIDFNSSTIQLSEATTGGGYPITVTVRVVGDYGPVEGAEIFLDALDGQFPNGNWNITGYADYNGYYIVDWIAPEVSSDTNFTIKADIRYDPKPILESINKTILVVAFLHNFTNIILSANTTSVIPGDYVEITVEVFNEIGMIIPNANATFTAPEGTFIGSGTDTIEVVTSSLGIATIIWNTTDTNPPIGGFDYPIEVSLIKEYYNTNTSSINITVTPEVQKLLTSSIPSPTSITQGANVTITIHVTANGGNIEGASVRIIAQSGIFESSSTEIAILNTDTSGNVVFTWLTSEMTVTTARDYSFTISASLPGYDDSDSEIITVHVEPIATTPGPDGPGLSTYEMLGIILGVVGGILLIGLIGYLLLRKKPI